MRERAAGNVIILILFLVLIITALAAYILVNKNNESSVKKDNSKILLERIPKSSYHSPDGTWWGYNQAKVARYGDRVFMYVIDNQDSANKTSSKMVIYQKTGDGAWQKGAGFTTSRPGNILVDSKGVLHAFVFEPLAVEVDDSRGKLIHYYFLKAAQGDIKTYEREVIIDNQDGSETVNIRVGAAIAPNDTLSIGFGLTEFNPKYEGHSEHLYYKKSGLRTWEHLIAGQNLGHDFYYPFIFASDKNFYLMPVQDDYYAPDPARYNLYQKILFFEYNNNEWTQQMVVDLSNHPMAKERLRLLEQSDLWVDKSGQPHIVYKLFTDPDDSWRTDRLVYASRRAGQWSSVTIAQDDTDWARFFEYKNRLYFLLAKSREIVIKPVGGGNEFKVSLPQDVQGYYPYVASSKTGQTLASYLDLVLQASDATRYDKSASYYLRINTAELDKL